VADPLALARHHRDGLAIAAIMARKGIDAAAIGAALDLTLSDGPMLSRGSDMMLVGTGPGCWLAIAEGAAPDFAATLATRLSGLASISDQSSGYSVKRIAGDGARRLLQRGAAIDLHPSVFAAGSVATTVIAHIGVILWQVDDAPTYDIATFRSFAGSFDHWLEQATDALPF
jgi:methylglutamate dehydrogenase subunit D